MSPFKSSVECRWILTSSSAVAKRPRDASYLSVVSFIASLVQYLECSFLLLVTSTSYLPVRTIRFCSVAFGLTSSLAVIHTIHGRPWLCIVWDRAWSVSHCRATDAWWSNSRIPAVNNRLAAGAIYNHGAAVIDRKARCSLRIEILAYPTCIRRPR